MLRICVRLAEPRGVLLVRLKPSLTIWLLEVEVAKLLEAEKLLEVEVEKRASLPASVRESEFGVTGVSWSPNIVIPWDASNFKASS